MTNGIGRVGWRNFVPTNNPLWDNLLAYWSGDNTANDSKGTANGTLVNGATYSTGKINGGFSLDGINDFISISPSFGTNLMTNTKAHSYAAWIYPNNVTTGNAFIVQCGQSDNGTTMALSTNKLAYFFNGGNGTAVSNGSLSISANAWNHVAISYNGSGQVSFYINGVFDSTRNAAWVNGATSNITRIGAYMGGLLYFNGKIDEVAIWSKALNSTEVTELYNGGAGKQYVAPAPAYTARTTAFAAATGITDATILNALNTFDTGLISNGLDTKMKALYPFVGGTANTHKFNFMDARDSDAAYRLAFNGGWVHSATGALPNGTNAYADTKLTPSTDLVTNNTHISTYLRTNTDGSFIDMGAAVGDSRIVLYCKFSGTLYGDFYSSAINRIIYSMSGIPSTGLFSLNRTSSTVYNAWRNSTKIGTNTNASSNTPPTIPMYIGAYNNSSPLYSNRQIAFSSIGSGLSDAEQAQLYTLTQALQTSLSRQV